MADGACSGSFRGRYHVLVCCIAQNTVRRERTISATKYDPELILTESGASQAQETRIAGIERGMRRSPLVRSKRSSPKKQNLGTGENARYSRHSHILSASSARTYHSRQVDDWNLAPAERLAGFAIGGTREQPVATTSPPRLNFQNYSGPLQRIGRWILAAIRWGKDLLARSSEECLSARPALSTPSAQGVDRRCRCRGMRFRRTPSGAPVPACTASVFQSSVKGQVVADENQQTASTHLSPLQTHQLASALPQTLLPGARSFFDRSIFAQSRSYPLAQCPVHPSHGSWMLTRDAGGCVHCSFRQRYGRQHAIAEALSEQPEWDGPQQNAGQGPTQSTSASTTRFRQRNQCQGVSKQLQLLSTRQ